MASEADRVLASTMVGASEGAEDTRENGQTCQNEKLQNNLKNFIFGASLHLNKMHSKIQNVATEIIKL